MKLSVLALLFTVTLPVQAFATVVDFNDVGLNLNMGTLVAGQNGQIRYTRPGAAVHVTEGMLSAGTMLEFSYSFTGNLGNRASNALGAFYNYTNSGTQYTGVAASFQSTPPTLFLNGDTNASWTNGIASAPLLFATANVIKGQNTATVTLSNFSKGFASFIDTFTLLRNNPSIQSLSYRVTALTAVPLPAALPLFMTGLAGLFGFARSRRKLTA